MEMAHLVPNHAAFTFHPPPPKPKDNGESDNTSLMTSILVISG